MLSSLGTTEGWRVISQSMLIIALPYWRNTEACMGVMKGVLWNKKLGHYLHIFLSLLMLLISHVMVYLA